MNKKSYLLKLLNSLKDIRPTAEQFETIILQWAFDDQLIDELLSVIRQVIHQVSDEITKEKLQKGLQVLEHIKQLENKSKAEDEEDLTELDTLLSQM